MNEVIGLHSFQANKRHSQSPRVMMTEPTIRRTDSDRQTERNCQSNRQTKRVKLKRLREKENKILPTVNSDRSELRKREGGGMGRGRGREKKKCARDY